MECFLGDIADVTMGQSPKSEFYNTDGQGMPFLQGNRTFGKKYPAFDTYTTMPTKMARAGDVIMSVRAPVGDLNITPVDMCLGRGVCSIRMKNGNQDFLFYLLKYYMPHLLNKESGTVFGSVNRNDINGLVVKIPDSFEEQRRIASMLALFDEKIENNEAINENLEEQAMLLINEYCSSSIATIELGEVMSFENGFAFQSSIYLSSGCYRIITIKNVQDGKIDSQGASYIDEIPPRMKPGCLLTVGDVLISLTGNVGRVGIVYENNLLLNQRVAKFVPVNRIILPWLYYYFRLDSTKTSLETIAKGTAQQNLSPVETLKLQIPFEMNSAKHLSKVLLPLFKREVANNIESLRLTDLRDALLPRLMSGELDVPKLDL